MGLVATKLLVPPARPGQVPRGRLHERLAVARSRPLTVVAAPAGFGKTTLVSTWLRDQHDRFAWLTLDEDDDVPGRVLEYVLAALRGVGEPVEGALALLESGGSAATVPAVLTTLINDLAAMRSDLVLVVDDFHVLTQPEILDAAAFLVDRCPPRLHLVVLSRQEPALPMSRWRAAGLVAEIGTAQLRFSSGEAAALLRSVTGAQVDAGTAADLERRTEGWAAGLQLLGIGLRDGAAAPRTAPAVGYRPGDRYVLDYLADEVLRGQPPEVRTFLRRTAVLDTLTAPLCDAVTGRTDSAAMIDRLERDNLFLTPLDDVGHWHRYHGLFADYLRAELDPAEAADCHARAARWYLAQDAPAETIKHAVAAGDTDLAAHVISTVAEDQIRRGELATLLGWLNRLPENEVRSRALLAGLKGWLLYLGGRVEEADTYARIADARMPADAPATDRAMLRTFQAYLALTRNEPETAAALATEALDLLDGSTSFFRAAAMGVLGQARRLTGDRRGAIEVLRAAVTLGERSGNPLSALESTGYLAPLLYVQGRLREAIVLCEDALHRYADPAGRPLPMAGLAEVPLGTLRYERDDLDAAAGHLVDGIAHCERMGTTSYSLLGLRTLARLHVTRGDVDDGFRALLAARRLADAAEDHRRARLVVATTADLHLRTGNVGAAEQALREIADAQPSTSDYEQLTRARLHLARDNPATAMHTLSWIERRAVREGRDGSLVAILTLIARVHAARGETDRARAALARAVALAAPDGYRRTFLDEGPALAGLLQDVRATAPAFVADLRGRIPARSTRSGAGEPRTIDEIGVIQPLTDTQRRILELIATGMSNQQVADKLFITVGTTKWHLNQIYGRLQARNRTEAVARARELHLI